MATQSGSRHRRAWLDILARDVCALWLAALVLELSSRLLSGASVERPNARIEATLVALQLGAQTCALLGLLPFRALAGRLEGRARLLIPLLAALLAALLVRPAAAALTSGAFISAQTYASALRHAMTVGAGLAFGAIVHLGVASGFRRTARGRGAVAFVMLALAAGCTWAHVEIFPAQYPEAHLVLLATAALCAQVGFADASSVLSARGDRAASFLRWLALPLLVAAGLFLAALLPPSKSTSARLLLRDARVGPVLALLPKPASFEIARELRALSDSDPFEPRGLQAPRLSVPADWNFLFIVIDSLRADAVPPTVDEPDRTRFSRADAPFLADLADRSYRFRRVYTGATYTYRSMPAMFGSQQPLGSKRRRAALGVMMAEQGRTPVAVVNDFFAQPIDENIARLLDGFVDLRMYQETAQHRQRALTRRVLERMKDQPFFAWLHYYGVHWPGWDGKPVPRASKHWPQNYKRGLRWVDGEIEWLLQQLDRAGVADRTVLVITADHGEGLMDTGHMFHGPVVYEEAVRVPLIIFVPGREGAIIEDTVGTIDIVPTLLELSGGHARLSHHGASLVPLMTGPEQPASTAGEPRFFVSGTDRQIGVVRGSDKHVFDRKTGVHMHFDLAADPFEHEDVFDEHDEAHRALLGELVRQFPQVFETTLSVKAEALLDERLAQIDPARPPAKLPFLLRLIALTPSEARLAWARRVFESSKAMDVKCMVADELFEIDAVRIGRLLRRHLSSLQAASETSFVNALADLGIGAFERGFVAQRLSERLSGSTHDWLPWLRLVSEWSHEHARDLAILRRVTQRCSSDAAACDELTIRVLLRTLANADLHRMKDGSVAPALSRWLDHLSLGVQQDAARALGRTRMAGAETMLRSKLAAGPLNVRLGALEGLTSLLGPEALMDVRAMAEQPEFEATCVRLATSIGTQEALAFLDALREDSKSRFIRANAKRAAAELRARLDAR